MPGGVGILVPNPLTSPADMARLTLPSSPEEASRLVREKLPHVLQAVHDIRVELDGKASARRSTESHAQTISCPQAASTLARRQRATPQPSFQPAPNAAATPPPPTTRLRLHGRRACPATELNAAPHPTGHCC
jgi:hypothetical protein